MSSQQACLTLEMMLNHPSNNNVINGRKAQNKCINQGCQTYGLGAKNWASLGFQSGRNVFYLQVSN